jgi:hypothetical protein
MMKVRISKFMLFCGTFKINILLKNGNTWQAVREKCVNSSKWQYMASCEGEMCKQQQMAINGKL